MKTKLLKVTILGSVILLWVALVVVESYQLYNQLIFSP